MSDTQEPEDERLTPLAPEIPFGAWLIRDRIGARAVFFGFENDACAYARQLEDGTIRSAHYEWDKDYRVAALVLDNQNFEKPLIVEWCATPPTCPEEAQLGYLRTQRDRAQAELDKCREKLVAAIRAWDAEYARLVLRLTVDAAPARKPEPGIDEPF
jgi:hypothetical protein